HKTDPRTTRELIYFLLVQLPPEPTLFPYTTLFRSAADPPAPQQRRSVDPIGEIGKISFIHRSVSQKEGREQRTGQHHPPNDRQTEEQRGTGSPRRRFR